MAEKREMGYYVEGSTVLRENPQADRTSVSENTRRNRERSLRMNFGYIAFLTAAAVVTVTICVNYLKLQAAYTALQKESTSLQTQYSDLKLANDAEYNRIMSSVNLEEVRRTAIEDYGMNYATKSQIVTYDNSGNDYVKQYEDVPDLR